MNTNQSTRTLGYVIAAFVLGISGTALVMSRRAPSTESAPKPSQEQHREEHHGEGEGAVIKLSAEALKTAGIRVETARIQMIGENISVPGTVEVSPSRGAKVTPPAPGKIVRLLASPGDTVNTGQALAVLESFEVAQAQASVGQAVANVSQVQAAVQTARAEVSVAQSGVSQAEALVQQSKTKLASAQQTLSRQRELASAGAFAQAPLLAAQQEVVEAQSELMNASKEDAAHEVTLARVERLFASELVSKQELDQERLHHEQDHIRLERAKSRLEAAQQTHIREKRIADAGLLNAREVQTAEADVRQTQSEVFSAQQGVIRAQQDRQKAVKGEAATRTSLRGAMTALSAARVNLSALVGHGVAGSNGSLIIRAPIGGAIAERLVTQGEAVERATSLFVIENVQTVMVNAQVSEKDVSRVQLGQAVEISVASYPNTTFPGFVQSVASRIDEKTRTLPVRCMVENRNARLKPEMFARVSLSVGARSQAVVVPLAALDEHADERHVFIQTGEGFERRAVEVGKRTASRVELKSGVKAGERVVVEGVFILESEAKKDELKGHED